MTDDTVEGKVWRREKEAEMREEKVRSLGLCMDADDGYEALRPASN